VAALISPDEVILNLDKAARLERDRRRLSGRPRPGSAERTNGSRRLTNY
jgi:hypothetical protein